MRLKDLKDNEKLFLHFTLTDTCLFAKSLRDARKIEMILDQNVYEENKEEFQRLLNGKATYSQAASDIILAKKDKYFKMIENDTGIASESISNLIGEQGNHLCKYKW